MSGPSVRLDLRVALPIITFGVIILIIIFVELCGREDIEPLAQVAPPDDRPTATLGPTFTPGPSPTLGPPDPTATSESLAGGRARDTVRVRDLVRIQESLEAYLAEEGNYPSTGGSVQTLCAYSETDVGCELREVMDDVPEDPLGAATENGYWFTSTEETYTIYAQLESDEFDECPDHPDHLREIRALFCLQSP